MLNYEIADCLTRIRNATMKKHPSVLVRKTKFNKQVLKVLKEQGSIKDFADDANNERMIHVELSYVNGRSSLKSVKVESRPGLRKYFRAKEIPLFKSGLSYGVISTSKGVMTTHQAAQMGVGGELICVVE